MRVEMKTHIGGYRNLEPWPEVGEVIDVPDHEAADLIANGYAKEASREREPEAGPDDGAEAADGEPEAGPDDGAGTAGEADREANPVTPKPRGTRRR